MFIVYRTATWILSDNALRLSSGMLIAYRDTPQGYESGPSRLEFVCYEIILVILQGWFIVRG